MDDDELFSLRADQNGLRPVFLLGNESGDCPYACAFCGVRRSPKTSSRENIRRFDELFRRCQSLIDGVYHPVIYNRGNATDQKEFSRETLSHVLRAFCDDERMAFVSINSREESATKNTLDFLADMELSYPIHFILGVESFSERARDMLGKDVSGELHRFVNRLAQYNERGGGPGSSETYLFGLDVNLVFLPDLYVEQESSGLFPIETVKEGFLAELQALLDARVPAVPMEVNLHPYHAVEMLPYESADLGLFVALLPDLQRLLEERNGGFPGHQSHLFVGVEGLGYDDADSRSAIAAHGASIDVFNRSGRLPGEPC